MILRNGGILLDAEIANISLNKDTVLSFKSKAKLPLTISYWSGVQSGCNEKVVWKVDDFYAYIIQVHKTLNDYYLSSNKYALNEMNQITVIKSDVRCDDSGVYYQVCLKSKGLENSDYIELVELSTLLL